MPQVFTEEAELATQGTLREEPFQVVVIKDVEAFKGIDFANSPPLLGYVSTLEKDTADILLQADDEKPLLARWQYGLGKTVAFTSDVKDRWAADWLSWAGYGKFWPQLVRETMRRQENGEFDLRIEKDGDEARISITALEDDGGFRNELNSQIRVLDPQQNVSVLDVYQTGPGTYETGFPVPERGPYVVRVVGDEAGVSRILPYSYPEEYHFYPSTRTCYRKPAVLRAARSAPRSRISSRGTERVSSDRPRCGRTWLLLHYFFTSSTYC